MRTVNPKGSCNYILGAAFVVCVRWPAAPNGWMDAETAEDQVAEAHDISDMLRHRLMEIREDL